MRYDPYDAETQRDPYPVYRELRDRAPVYHDAERGFWALSRFDDVLWAAHEPTIFCSGEGIALEGQARSPFPNLITMDDPRHGQLRALVARGFTSRPVATFEPRVRDLAQAMLAELAATPGADLVAGLTGPLPMTVVGDLIGVAPGDRVQFRVWADAIVHQDVDRPETVAAGRAAAGAVVDHFRGIIATRRADPGDDLVSALLEAVVDGERLTDEEILGFCFLLVVAGTETTTNLLGLGVLALAGTPAERARLASDPSLIAGAVEEMLRWGSPVQGLAAHHDARGATSRRRDPRGCEGAAALRVGQPRRTRLHRPRAVRRDAEHRASPRVRARGPLLPRGRAGPARGAGRVRGAPRPLCGVGARVGRGQLDQLLVGPRAVVLPIELGPAS